jgi:cytochrome c-type biogenesis protein CcmH/NrfF
MPRIFPRRSLLSTAALAGVGAAAATALPREAAAIRIEEADAPRQALMLEACEARTTHDKLMQALIAQLKEQEGEARAREIVRQMSCPICGCALAPEG